MIESYGRWRPRIVRSCGSREPSRSLLTLGGRLRPRTLETVRSLCVCEASRCRAPQDVTRLWTDGSLKWSLKSEAGGESMPPPSTGGTPPTGSEEGPDRTGRGDDGGVGRLRTNLGRREIFRFLPLAAPATLAAGPL